MVWPGTPWSVSVSLPPEQLETRLVANVDAARAIRRARPLRGWVRGRRFCVRRQNHWRRYLQPRMYGEIASLGTGGSVVTVEVRPHLGLLYYLGRIVVFVNALAVALYADTAGTLGGTFVVSLGLALALTAARFHREVHRARGTLVRVLQGEHGPTAAGSG